MAESLQRHFPQWKSAACPRLCFPLWAEPTCKDQTLVSRKERSFKGHVHPEVPELAEAFVETCSPESPSGQTCLPSSLQILIPENHLHSNPSFRVCLQRTRSETEAHYIFFLCLQAFKIFNKEEKKPQIPQTKRPQALGTIYLMFHRLCNRH